MSTGSQSIFVERGPVSLGCGTLILIALIVMFFSNSNRHCDTTQLEHEVRQLQRQVGTLKDAIDRQSAQLSRLEQERSPPVNLNVEKPATESATLNKD